eukprot:8600204-Karenia_brevis.AAC.1
MRHGRIRRQATPTAPATTCARIRTSVAAKDAIVVFIKDVGLVTVLEYVSTLAGPSSTRPIQTSSVQNTMDRPFQMTLPP